MKTFFLFLLSLTVTLEAENRPMLSQEDQDSIAYLNELKKNGDRKQEEIKDKEIERALQLIHEDSSPEEWCITFVATLDTDAEVFKRNLGGIALDYGQTYKVLKKLVFENNDVLQRRVMGLTAFDLLVLKHQFKLLETILAELNEHARFLPLETNETVMFLMALKHEQKQVDEETISRINTLLKTHRKARLRQLTDRLKGSRDYSRWIYGTL